MSVNFFFFEFNAFRKILIPHENQALKSLSLSGKNQDPDRDKNLKASAEIAEVFL
jgi:hypothetical protein